MAQSNTSTNSTGFQAADLTGLFDIQRRYLTGISSNDTQVTIDVSGIEQQLDQLAALYEGKDVSSAPILDKQAETSNVINIELNRLREKKQSIDNALIGKQRAVALNDSYRSKLSMMTNIKVTVVITLAICILLVLLGRRYPEFPSIIITLLILIVLAVGVIYSLFLYSIMSSRSKLNYNELDLGGPKVLTPEEEKAAQLRASKAGDLLGTIKPEGCVGSECCSEGTSWDENLSKCRPYNEGENADTQTPATSTSNTTQAFTTMNSTGYVNSPTEYDKYGRV